MKHVLWVLIIGAMIPACGSVSSSPEADRSGPRVKAPAFELLDLDGKKCSLAELKGKVVFLDIWATWCPPCIVSSPEVEKLHEDYSQKNVEVLSFSLDQSESAVRRFISKRNMKTRVVMVGSSDVSARYRVSGIPSFYLIDQEGYLVASWEGYSSAFPNAWRKELDRLIKT